MRELAINVANVLPPNDFAGITGWCNSSGYNHIKTTNVSTCEIECRADPACNVIFWGNGTWCTLLRYCKDGHGDWRYRHKYVDASRASSTVLTLWQNNKYCAKSASEQLPPGDELGRLALGTSADKEDCAQRCRDTAGCGFATFAKSNGGDCILYRICPAFRVYNSSIATDAETYSITASSTAGRTKVLAKLYDGKYCAKSPTEQLPSGDELCRSPAADKEACAQRCRDTFECGFVTFAKSNSDCILYRICPAFREYSQSIATGVETFRISYPEANGWGKTTGTNLIKAITTGVPNCEHECRANPACTVISWIVAHNVCLLLRGCNDGNDDIRYRQRLLTGAPRCIHAFV